MNSKLLIIILVTSAFAAGVAFDLRHTSAPTQTAPTSTTPPPSGATSAAQTKKMDTRTPAPDFIFSTHAGEQHKLSSFTGRTVFLTFWATWCAPCIEEMPALLSLAARYPDRLTVIAVSVDKDPQQLDRFFSRFSKDIQDNLALPNVIIGHDPEKSIAQEIYMVFKYPETLWITPEQTIYKKFVGKTDFTTITLPTP